MKGSIPTVLCSLCRKHAARDGRQRYVSKMKLSWNECDFSYREKVEMKVRRADFVPCLALQLHSPVFYFVASCIASCLFSLIIALLDRSRSAHRKVL